jgi:hypothetical protein
MVKKEGSQEKIESAPKEKKMSKKEIDQALLENFITLQKVLTNLSAKFEDLSSNINKLLELFELTAKDFAEKYQEGFSGDTGAGVDKDFLKKLDALLDQNKTIAKGIMMMEERIRNKNPSPTNDYYQAISTPRNEEIGRASCRERV